MTKPKFEIGQTVHGSGAVNIIYDVIDRRWDAEPKRRSFDMAGAEPSFQYLLGNGRFIEDGLKLKDATSGWIDECHLFSLEEMREQLQRDRDDEFDDSEYEYDGDTGKAFINGQWIVVNQQQQDRFWGR
jgi:hypothetical protein